MHTSVHELCMHNIIHTLYDSYCAYLCLYPSRTVYVVHCTPRIVCIREYYELVCILLATTRSTLVEYELWYAYNHSS